MKKGVFDYFEEMKYIIFEDCGIKNAVIFPNSMIHASMAHKLGLKKIVSAGFISLKAGGFYCYGKSISLHKRAGREDSSIVKEKFEAGT